MSHIYAMSINRKQFLYILIYDEKLCLARGIPVTKEYLNAKILNRANNLLLGTLRKTYHITTRLSIIYLIISLMFTVTVINLCEINLLSILNIVPICVVGFLQIISTFNPTFEVLCNLSSLQLIKILTTPIKLLSIYKKN